MDKVMVSAVDAVAVVDDSMMVATGKVDAAILGGMQASERGDLSNTGSSRGSSPRASATEAPLVGA